MRCSRSSAPSTAVAPTSGAPCPRKRASRFNYVDPKASLADILARIADLPASRLHELLPWEWKLLRQADKPTDQQSARS
jgi:hypothetical protein